MIAINKPWEDLTEDEKLAVAGVRRVRMPDRRTGEAIEIDHMWSPGTSGQIVEPLLITVGRFASGRIGEVFIDTPVHDGRKSSERQIALRNDIATLISIALQYGAPIEVLRAAMARADVNYMGTMKSMPHSIAGTVLDQLAAESTS